MQNPRRVISTAVLSAVAVSFLSACAEEEPQDAYCVDQNNVVVDEDYCDDDGDGRGGFYWINYGYHGSGYGPGRQLNGGTTINARDRAARAKAGLPETGAVKPGTRASAGLGKGPSGGGGKSYGG